MYVSGLSYTFTSRLHQLAATSGDLANFTIEGKTITGNYSGQLPSGQIAVWNREIAKKYSTNFGNTSYYYSGAIR